MLGGGGPGYAHRPDVIILSLSLHVLSLRSKSAYHSGAFHICHSRRERIIRRRAAREAAIRRSGSMPGRKQRRLPGALGRWSRRRSMAAFRRLDATTTTTRTIGAQTAVAAVEPSLPAAAPAPATPPALPAAPAPAPATSILRLEAQQQCPLDHIAVSSRAWFFCRTMVVEWRA